MLALSTIRRSPFGAIARPSPRVLPVAEADRTWSGAGNGPPAAIVATPGMIQTPVWVALVFRRRLPSHVKRGPSGADGGLEMGDVALS